MPKILQRRRLVPNVHSLEVQAPEIARKCRAGQFILVMPDERGERIPLTIADWDSAAGKVTVVFSVLGTSTRKLAELREGDEIPVFTGPLGRAIEIDRFGTVLCLGGCFGIAAIHPIARALKEKGNRVVSIIDAKAPYLVYWEDKLRAASDDVRLLIRDDAAHEDPPAGGSEMRRRIAGLLDAVGPVDRMFAVGCTFMMQACAEATRGPGIKTIVSLNPIMVDGTGMCGACRVTAGGRTKFACVDGPDFDAHQVDWEELYSRRKSYFEEEIRSVCAWEQERYP